MAAKGISGIILAGMPKGKGEDSPETDEEGTGSGDAALSAMEDFIAAVKSGNAADALEAYGDLP